MAVEFRMSEHTGMQHLLKFGALDSGFSIWDAHSLSLRKADLCMLTSHSRNLPSAIL